MEQKIINPWTWQDDLGFVQAKQIISTKQLYFCAGQTSVDGNGTPVHEGDMSAQIHCCLDNLEILLREVALDLSNVVRLNYYTTDVDRFFEAMPILASRLAAARCRPVSTLLGVERLAFKPLLVEIEATAAA